MVFRYILTNRNLLTTQTPKCRFEKETHQQQSDNTTASNPWTILFLPKAQP
jgi:hypothetical protein